MRIHIFCNSCNGTPVGSYNFPVLRQTELFRFLNKDCSKFIDLAFEKEPCTEFTPVKAAYLVKYRCNFRNYNTMRKYL